jgi:hypothetical protein
MVLMFRLTHIHKNTARSLLPRSVHLRKVFRPKGAATTMATETFKLRKEKNLSSSGTLPTGPLCR